MKTKSKSRVCLIGMFPPPLHGMSLINDYVRNQILMSSEPLVIDYSPSSLDRGFLVRFGKAIRVGHCVLKLICCLVQGRVGSVYLGLSGGNGQIYDAIFVAICRLFGRKLYLHHHSYQYLDRPRWLSRLLFAVSGKDAVHVVACAKMANDLKRQYPVANEIRIISGIAALEPWKAEVTPREQVKTIGFLSNISIEKGVLEFLEIASRADRAKLPIRFLLAGPYCDDEVKRLAEVRLAVLPNVTCVGAVYGSDKLAFFDSIDIFLLPSHNESEGLVIHEAMSRAVPVIAYSRGCVEQIVSDSVGLRLAPAADYVTDALNKIDDWLSKPEVFRSVSQAAFGQYCEASAMHIGRMDDLCAELIYGESS